LGYENGFREQLIFGNGKMIRFNNNMQKVFISIDYRFLKKLQAKSVFHVEKNQTNPSNIRSSETSFQNLQFRVENQVTCELLEKLSFDLKTYFLGTPVLKQLWSQHLLTGFELRYRVGVFSEILLEGINLLNIKKINLTQTNPGPNQNNLSLPIMPLSFQLQLQVRL